jgi:hypothetical protein
MNVGNGQIAHNSNAGDEEDYAETHTDILDLHVLITFIIHP